MPVIALCHGCFDLLHPGHIEHLNAAKKYGERLIVSVTSDKYVNKGNGRPIFTAKQRMEMLYALECVDEVLSSDSPDAIAIIKRVKPNFYVKGSDYQGKSCPEFNAVRFHGGKVVFTDTPKFSTTELIERIKNVT